MASKYNREKFTEHLTKELMKIHLGENDFGNVFPQGDVRNITKISTLLKKAGGKPNSCDIDDYTGGGKSCKTRLYYHI